MEVAYPGNSHTTRLYRFGINPLKVDDKLRIAITQEGKLANYKINYMHIRIYIYIYIYKERDRFII